MRISDWSSDVCPSDLLETATEQPPLASESVEAAFAFFQEDGTGARVDAQVDQDPEIVAPEWSDARDSIDTEAGSEEEIGRTSGRERVRQYVKISVVAD